MERIKEGQRVPSVIFRNRANDEWVDVDSTQLFEGKRVIVFALPGAFTPTCSSTHLPRYEDLAPAFKNAGIDDVICMSVNDGFVMEAWAREQGCENVKVISDGNGEFAAGVGMLVDKSDLGFGKRSWRYAMVVNDGVVEKLFAEPDKPGDPFEVSDADTMWEYVAGEKAPERAVIFSRPGCPHCARAKDLLRTQGIGFDEIVVGRDTKMSAVTALTGRSTVPQVFLDGRHIGGADDLTEFFATRMAS